MPAGPLAMAFGLQRREEARKTSVNGKITGAVNSFGQLSGQESVGGYLRTATSMRIAISTRHSSNSRFLCTRM